MKLKEIRNARGLSQRELSEMTGVDRVTIARYEGGQCIPKVDKAVALASALNVSLDELLKEDSDEPLPDD